MLKQLEYSVFSRSEF